MFFDALWDKQKQLVAQPYALEVSVRYENDTTYLHWSRAMLYERPKFQNCGEGLRTVIGPFGSAEDCDRFCKGANDAGHDIDEPDEPDDSLPEGWRPHTFDKGKQHEPADLAERPPEA